MDALDYEFLRLRGVIKKDSNQENGARFDVLLSLWSHTNHRNRAWINFDTISEETGYTNRTTISEAFKYLQERGAIYNVPLEYRMGHEPKHKQVRVWQLTGVMLINGVWEQYSCVKAEYLSSTIDEAIHMGIQNVVTEFLDAGKYGLTITREDKTSHLKSLVLKKPVTLCNQTSNLMLPEVEIESCINDISTPSNSTKFGGKQLSSIAEHGNQPQYITRRTDQDTDKKGKSIAKAVDPSTLPQFVQHFLIVTKQKWERISEPMRTEMNANMRGFVKETGKYESIFPSVIDLYDQDPVFAEWIRATVTQQAKVAFQKTNEDGSIKQSPPSPGNFLARCRGYHIYQQWLKTDVGQTTTKRVKAGIATPTQPNTPPVVTGEDLGDYIW
jgi:hypothetical protein